MNRPISFSNLEAYRTCPRQFHEVTVLRLHPFVETDATRWGNLVHKACEDRIEYGTELPDTMAQWRKYMDRVAAMPGEKYVEKEMALGHNFSSAPWAESWTRGKGDLCVVNGRTGAILDYKTGKVKPTEQLRLYSAMLFALRPELDTIHTQFAWFKTKTFTNETIQRDQVPRIWQALLPRYRKLEDAFERDKWPPNPSGLCKGWCPCTTCEFYEPKRR